MPRSSFVHAIQALLAALFVAFCSWYTSCGGPLDAQEIDRYARIMSERGQSPERITMLRAFLEDDSGDDFVMVNLIELREPPEQVPGVAPGDTAQQVLGKYMEHMWPELLHH